jgi:hypothetical protein
MGCDPSHVTGVGTGNNILPGYLAGQVCCDHETFEHHFVDAFQVTHKLLYHDNISSLLSPKQTRHSGWSRVVRVREIFSHMSCQRTFQN